MVSTVYHTLCYTTLHYTTLHHIALHHYAPHHSAAYRELHFCTFHTFTLQVMMLHCTMLHAPHNTTSRITLPLHFSTWPLPLHRTTPHYPTHHTTLHYTTPVERTVLPQCAALKKIRYTSPPPVGMSPCEILDSLEAPQHPRLMSWVYVGCVAGQCSKCSVV